jgi:hypothetical protein
MELNNLLSNIHWIPVIVLTVISFVIGFVWHSSYLFGKTWKHENNPDNIKIKINAPLIFIGTAVLHFIAIIGLSSLISDKGRLTGLYTGLFISVIWILPSMGGTYLFANRSLKLLAIDAGMYVVLFSVSGYILGIW